MARLMKTHHMTRSLAVAATLTLSAFTLAACSGNGDAADKGSPQRVALTELTPARNPDPQAMAKADALLQGNGVAEAARSRFLSRCMADAGESWSPAASSQTTARSLAGLKPLSVQEARESGYAAAQSTEAVAGGQTGKDAFVGNPANGSVTAELMGVKGMVAKDGCLAKSYEAVYGSVEDGMRATGLLLNVFTPVISLAATDIDKGVTQKWVACMGAAGVKDVETPDLLSHQVLVENRAGGKEVAVADARCREEVGYEKAMTASINAYVTALFEQYGSDLAVLHEINKRGEQNAASIR